MQLDEQPKRTAEVQVSGSALSVCISGLKGFNLDERSFFLSAMRLKLKVLNSEEFKDRFIGMVCEYDTRLVYQRLMSGADKYNKQIDHDLDLVWSIYGSGRRSRTIGYTFKSKIRIYTNRYHIRKWMRMDLGQANMAGHAFHEYLHNMSYSHRGNKKRSMVYKAGYLVRDLALDQLKGRYLTPLHS